MGLKETQSLFVRLCLDSAFREQSFSEGGEARTFSSMEKEVRRHARSLVSKRLGAVKDILSATHSALGPGFAEEFRNFAAAKEEPKGLNRHRLDALAFAEHLAGSVRAGLLPNPLQDLLAHETMPARMWAEGRALVFRLHKYPPQRIRDLACSGNLPSTLPFRPCLLVWQAGRGRRRGYFWREFSPWP